MIYTQREASAWQDLAGMPSSARAACDMSLEHGHPFELNARVTYSSRKWWLAAAHRQGHSHENFLYVSETLDKNLKTVTQPHTALPYGTRRGNPTQTRTDRDTASDAKIHPIYYLCTKEFDTTCECLWPCPPAAEKKQSPSPLRAGTPALRMRPEATCLHRSHEPCTRNGPVQVSLFKTPFPQASCNGR
jgi:hypothetical protein